ncbi:MAG: hypothetical protein HY826_14555 [Actinobacteria bacterium]|nr:hypothetical protein [Actinomycetota bacterium]
MDHQSPPPAWTAVWRTGPDAGVAIALPAGRHLLGRAYTAGIRCDDQALQPHHALIEVTSDGSVRLTQLTGRVPLRVNDRPVDALTTTLTPGSVVEAGASTLLLVDHLARRPAADVHDRALLRTPRAVPEWSPVAPNEAGEAPTREGNSGGLVPALIGLAGAGALAMVLQQPMFFLFGALGALVAVGSWAAQHIATGRKFRTALAAFEHAVAMQERQMTDQRLLMRAHRVATVPTIDRAVGTILAKDSALWSRRAAHPDAFLAAIGINGSRPSANLAETEVDLPVEAALGPGARIGLGGPHGAAVARSLVLQLAASCGPADLRITVVTEHPDRWECMRSLPHLTLPDGTSAVVTEADLANVVEALGGHASHHLFVTDQPALLATRTSPLRRAIGDAERDALIVVLPALDATLDATRDASVPHVCTGVLITSAGPLARWVPDVRRTMLPQHILLVGVGERATARCAAAVKGLSDPEDPLAVAGGVPRQISLVELLRRDRGGDLTARSIAAGWGSADNGPHSLPCPHPRTAIGIAADGSVDIDLVRDGPHGLIAGTTGAGKSELLRSLVAGMAAAASPAQLTFVLIDYKGGATFDACAALPHVVGVVTDLDEQLADRALRSMQAELRRRERLLREHGVAELAELHAQAPSIVLPRLVIVIDEFAALVAEQPAFLHALVGVAQRGRSLGVHLLLATQRPNGVISDDIRANTNLRLALRLQDTTDAIDVVGVATPARLPRALPGRAVMRLGADDHLLFQTAQCTAPTSESRETELTTLVRTICEAARLADVAPPLPPWQPPLPKVLTSNDLLNDSAAAVGLIDEPDLQRTTRLSWSRSEGHTVVLGSAGSGVTSTLLTLARHDPAELYVIDARGDARWDSIELHPHCVAVVRLHEVERLQRLLHRLASRTQQHRGTNSAPILLIIDGLDALRRSLDDLETAGEYDALEQILADGASAGITIAAGVEQAAPLPTSFVSRCPVRWVLHVHDAHDAALLGVAVAHVPPPIPGRLTIASSGLTAQLVAVDMLAPPNSPSPSEATAPPIVVVPTQVDAAQLPDSLAADHITLLALGLEFATGEPLVMEVPDGENLLLVGNSRSGRSSGLARVASAWSVAHPRAWVGAILPRRSTFPSHLATRSAGDATTIAALLDELTAHLQRTRGANAPLALLVVDDAEMVEDPGGRLMSLAALGNGLCIAAAGRPDVLRQSYAHWTGVLRRSRLGLVAAGGNDLDGDLLGALLPRRTPVAARPGLWWAIDNSSVRLAQLALDRSAGSCDRSLAATL